MNKKAEGVFIIYTGGTIGSLPKDENDPMSPLVPKALNEVMKWMPNYNASDNKIFIDEAWVRLGFYSWVEPIDSSNIESNDWKKLANVVKDNYADWEGFVILHGTDTLAYTSSVISFMLDNLGKPVVLTGAQTPIGKGRSDAVQNFLTSIEIAGAKTLGRTVVPEVCVFFRDQLFRGCRTTKMSASSYSAFYSPNYLPLGSAGEYIVINNNVIMAPSPQTLNINDRLEDGIASLDIFPNMNPGLLRKILTDEDLRGVILQTFGAGNAPTTEAFLQVIDDAVKSGTIIVDVTQCRAGEVELGLYDVSAGLLSRGVISGMDMTPEAALTKLSVILGALPDKEKVTEEELAIAADKMQINLKGEQRQSIFNLHYPGGTFGEDEDPTTLDQIRPMVEGHNYQSGKLDKAILRIMGLELLEGKRGRIELKAYIDLPDANEVTQEEDNPHFLGKTSKKYNSVEGPQAMFLEIKKQALNFIEPQHPKCIRIVGTGAPFRWDKVNVALFVNP